MTPSSIARPPRATNHRASPPRKARKSGLGGTLIGVFIGIALGLGLAAGVAFYLMRAGNPYQAAVAAAAQGKDVAKAGRGEGAAADKPRFDFYKILPGVDESKLTAKAAERVAPDKATLERAISPEKTAPKETVAKVEDLPPPARDKAGEPPSRAPKSTDRFYLQAGSFANANEAENLKAQLALSGWEASVQEATLPDKGVRFRVRMGPYDNTGELTRVKNDLAKRGVDVAVIKGQ